MEETTDTLSMLNIFEIETDEGMRTLIGYVDPVRAGAEGISTRSIVGGFTPAADGGFNLATFNANPEFLAAIVDFMNNEPSRSPEVADQARQIPSQWLYVIDPRNQLPVEDDPPAADIIGCFAVDETGQIVPNSFQYNSEHKLFTADMGASGLLNDRRFFDWLNP